MSFTVFLGNLPTWVTADDIKQWLAAEDLVADAVKVIRNHETQESKGRIPICQLDSIRVPQRIANGRIWRRLRRCRRVPDPLD